MPKPVRATSRFALGAIATLALVFGGLAVPAYADDAPVEAPVVESVETPTAPVEAPGDLADEVITVQEEAPAPDAVAEVPTPEEPASEQVAMRAEPLSLPDTTSIASFSPQIEVFMADGSTPIAGQTIYFGDTIVVKGTGYDPTTNISNRPPVTVGDPTGVYVVFGSFASVWQPSASIPSSSRKVGAQKWAIPQASLDNIDPRYKAAVQANAVELKTDGSFEATIVVTEPTGGPLSGGNYGIYTYAAGGPANAVQELATLVNATVRPATATTTSLATNPNAASVEAGTSITLTATVGPAAAGQVEFRNGDVILGSAATNPVTGVATLVLGAMDAGTYGFLAKFIPTSLATYAASTSAVTSILVIAPQALASGSLNWGIKSSFNQYIVTTGGGNISLSGGASGASSFNFPQGSGGTWSSTTQVGTVPYAGAVHYYAHGGTLDLTFRNPSIVVHSQSSATLYFNGSAFASLNLGAASKSVGQGGAVTWSGVPTTLTSNGASAFIGFYQAGDALEPLTFTAGAAASNVGGGKVMVASAAAPTQRTPATTPPATTGVSVLGGTPSQGGMVTIEAGGYQPNEEGILIVIYSDPVVLATVTADANGVARWTGKLPNSLSGTHTLTMQGSVSHGAVVTLRPTIAKSSVAGCTITDATLTWGFKESFRAYITSTIANGDWTVADGASYATPEFSWAGIGSLDPETETGDLAFAGSVRFTGHDGVLDTTIANPRVLLTADGATLLLDVTGTTQDGSPINSHGVEFATLDLSAASPTEVDGMLTWQSIPAVLTGAGSAAFGTYEPGEALDPLTLSISLPATCGSVVDGATPQPEVTTSTDGPAGTELSWLWWLISGVVLLGIIIAIVVTVLRRRRTA